MRSFSTPKLISLLERGKPSRHTKRRATSRRRSFEALEPRQLLANGYVETNLVSDQAGAALIQDRNLVNPWGVALSPNGGAFSVANNGTGVATFYSGHVSGGAVGGSTFVKTYNSSHSNTLAVEIPGGFPTGQVFNGTSDFAITGSAGSSGPAQFIFASQTGQITGWNASVPPPSPSDNAQAAASVPGADFTGLAIDNVGTANFLYAADFQNGKIDVFDGKFHQVTPSGLFTDPTLPAGFAPFNIQNIGGQLYVTYAQRQSAGEDGGFVPIKTGGLVDVFDPHGNFVSHFSADTHLNAPWGLAQAPANFGQFSGDILVGDFGDGRVNAFKTDGTFDGQFTDSGGNVLSIDGLRGLSFGNGVSAGDSNALFFTADPGATSAAPEKASVLLLDPSAQGALSAVGNGTVSVVGGGEVVVDSSDPAAVVAIGNAQLAASEFDIAGVPGTSLTGNANLFGKVDNGVAAMADPLASLPAPAVPAQTFAGFHASGHDSVTLQPGAYTGDISVSGQATVTLMPGLYFLQGGISVTGNGQILGKGVTIYLASSQSSDGDDDDNQDNNNQDNNNQDNNNQGGNNQGGNKDKHDKHGDNKDKHGDNDGDGDQQGGGAAISLHGHGSIVLSAPTSGTYQSIALFEARDNGAPIVIDGNGSLFVTGTIYAPAAATLLSGNGILTVRDDLTDGITAQFIADDLRVNGNGDFDMRTAPTVGGAHGLFGVLDAVGTTPIVVTSTDLAPTEGLQFTGAVAAFAATTAGAAAADFSATINWGDGTSSAGTVAATANGGFLVNGSHTYAEEGTEPVTVALSDHSGNTATANDTATVADAPLIATSELIVQNSQGQNGALVVNNQVVATFVDKGGAEPIANYTATIDWGDSSATSAATISLSSDGTFFNVAGTHTYSQHGRYIVSVTIQDEGGAKTIATSVVTSGHTPLNDDDAFVEQSFDDLLGRRVDDASLAFFAAALQNGLSPSALANLLTQSDEFLENVIRRGYRDFLGRDADDGGLRFWLTQMHHGLTDQQLDAGFIGSPEFFTHGGGANQSWVKEMYFDLLGRAPDAGGLAFWLSDLDHGASRSSVALGFAASQEHEGMFVQDDYATYLGRGANHAEENSWVNAFQQGMTNEQIIAGFVGSNEYFKQQTSSD